MHHYVGFDVGKDAHWVCVLDGEGEMVLSRRVEATEEVLKAVCKEMAALEVVDERVVGIDLTGCLPLGDAFQYPDTEGETP